MPEIQILNLSWCDYMKEMNNTKQHQQMISSLYPDNLPGCKDAASENHIKDIWVFSLLAYQNISRLVYNYNWEKEDYFMSNPNI